MPTPNEQDRLKRAAADKNARAVLLTSAVRSRFSAGLDLREVTQGDAGQEA